MDSEAWCAALIGSQRDMTEWLNSTAIYFEGLSKIVQAKYTTQKLEHHMFSEYLVLSSSSLSTLLTKSIELEARVHDSWSSAAEVSHQFDDYNDFQVTESYSKVYWQPQPTFLLL